MSMRDHTKIQTQLLEGDRADDVAEHLATCAECQALDSELTAIAHNAPHLGGGVPAGLADRVIERVRAEAMGVEQPAAAAPTAVPTGGTAPTRATLDRTLPDRFRRPILRSLAVAATLLVLVGAVAVLSRGGDEEPREVLLASAARTEEAGPAEVEVTGDARVTVATPDEPDQKPDLSSIPVELQAHVEARMAEVMAVWQQQIAEFEARVQASFDEAQRLIEEQMARFREMFGQLDERSGSTPPPAPPSDGRDPSAPSSGTEQRPAPPADFTLGFDIFASGRVDPGQAIDLRGEVASDDGGRSGFEVRGRSDLAGVLVDGSWRAAADVGSALDTLLARADGASAVLRAAVDAELVGEVEVDGDSARHYRFTVDPTQIGRITGSAALGTDVGRWTADAWIDSDDLLRRLDVSAAGRFDPTGASGWALDLSLSLSGFGSQADLVVDGPPAGAAVEAVGSASVFGPFTPALAASLRGSAG